MKVHYCDLCDCPIHGRRSLLTISEEEVSSTEATQSFYKNKEVQEICETCKKILEKLFSNRKKGLVDLIKSIEEIDSLCVSQTKYPEDA